MEQNNYEKWSTKKVLVQLATRFDDLITRLYGNGHDPGDIPAIRDCVSVLEKTDQDHERRLISLEAEKKVSRRLTSDRARNITLILAALSVIATCAAAFIHLV